MERFKYLLTGFCFIITPLTLILAFAAHPNLGDITRTTEVDAWISEFHGNTMWRLAHAGALLVTIPFTVVFLKLMHMLEAKAGWLSFIAGSLGIAGCFMLAADKGALALVPTAFDTLPEDQFRQLRPGLEAMFHYEGWLWIVNLYVLIFVGLVLMGIALVMTKLVPYWQSLSIVAAGLVFFNPDIDVISLVASVLLAIGLVPIGFSILGSGASRALA
jgi:hypothetical protein